MTTRNNNWVRTGRTDTRKLCAACEARIMYGDPKPSNTWDARLRLSQEMLSLLLVGAAEFIEAGDGSAVDFVDWITETALGRPVVRNDHDGAPGRSESGGFAQHKHYRHRHPDPLPVVVLPPSLRRAAS